jgi:PAS domain S-box-containing protein
MSNTSPVNYFETLFRNGRENNVLIMNGKGIVIAISPSFTTHFGYTEQDIIGMDASILFTEEDREKNLPQRELEAVLGTGYSSDNNYLVNVNRRQRWVSGESLLLQNENGEDLIIKIIQDIHEKKILENEIRASNQFNESILESIRDPIFVLNEQQEVIKTNDAYNILFKTRVVPNAPLNFEAAISPFDRSGLLTKTVTEAIQTRKEFSGFEVEMFTANLDKKVFESSNSFVYNQGTEVMLVFMHDVTVSKQIEREREDVIGFIGHELRNPLANVVLCNEIMAEAIKKNNMEEVKDMLQRSKNNVMRLNKMITELYDLTKANAGNMKLQVSSFQFGEVIKEAIDMVHALQPAYNIIVEGQTGEAVEADKYRLVQVIVNYLSNGIKYSNGKTDVTIHVKREDEHIIVAVKDEGLGISKENLPYIFEKFFRAEKTKGMEGIGLGLYLCRQIINAHSGMVWAESEEGKGSVFFFSIPVKFYSKP